MGRLLIKLVSVAAASALVVWIGIVGPAVGVCIMYPVAIGAGVLVIALAGRRIAAKGMVDGIHCPGCGYNLTGNLSGVCPECGAPFARR